MRQIVYFSTASDRQDHVLVAGIVAQSREHNLRDSITGLLIAGGHRYLQVIEGPSDAIERLTSRLRRDERHVGMLVLVNRMIDQRSFDGWSMAFAREPKLDEFATFPELVAQMRCRITDAKLREQIDCFDRSFSRSSVRIDAPLWQIVARDRGPSPVDCSH